MSQNSNCEQHSDKTINEWLASSKLSNDTGTSSLINVVNNSSSTATAATLLNSSCMNLHLTNTLSKSAKSNRLQMNTPNQLRLELAGNCSSLLNDDMDDEPESSSKDETIEKTALRGINILSETTSNDYTAQTFGKRLELGMNNSGGNYYQASQFNRYLVSSPLLSSSSSQKESSVDEEQPKSADLLNGAAVNNSQPATATAKTIQLPPMMMIRSQNIPNGNFNAKISAGFSSSTINDFKASNSNSKPQFNSFTLNRNMESKQPKDRSEYYENASKKDENSLSKMLQDTTFRLSDLFNELSPNINTDYSNRNQQFQSTLPTSIKVSNTSNMYQQFPVVAANSSSPKHEGKTLRPQMLLQTINNGSQGSSSGSQVQHNPSFNKFPNPFGAHTTQPAKSLNTSKFYTNFYRNPNLQANANEHCKNFI